MEIGPLSESDLNGAASLLAERFVRQRDEGMPWPDRALEPSTWIPRLEAALSQGNGSLAVENGGPLGFVCGHQQREEPWLPSSWVAFDAHAATSASAYRELYASLAGAWVARGCLDHYAVVPVLEDVVTTWFGLGFGLEQVYGIRSLENVATRKHDRASIRRASVEDLPLVMELADAISRYQAKSPVFGVQFITLEEFEAGHKELFEQPDVHYWLALINDRPAGVAVFVPVDAADEPHLPDATIELSFAAVADDLRGAGVGSALTSAGLVGARAADFSYCVIDWRSPNLTSGRTWTRWGFRPWAYRLHRTIDRRIGPT